MYKIFYKFRIHYTNINAPQTVHSPTRYVTHTAVSFISCPFCFNVVVMRRRYVGDLDKDGS